MATNPFDAFDEPVPDSRLPVVPTSDTADLRRDGWTRGPDGKIIWAGDQSPPTEAPASDLNPFDQFDEESAPVQTVDVPPSDAPQESLGQQFGNATANTVAGVGQGTMFIADAGVNAAGAIMGEGARYGSRLIGAGADALGYDGESIRQAGESARTNFYNPVTIGGLIEKAVPTPTDGVGKGVRFASQLAGGVVNIPGLTSIPNALMGTVPARVLPREPANALMAAADRQGVQPMAADVGGPIVRRLTSAAAQGPISAGPVIGAGQRVLKQSAAAVDRAAAGVGTAATGEAAGEAATRGAKAFMKSTSRDAGFAYERAAKAAGDVKITPTNAVSELDRHIAELADTPGGAESIGQLQLLRDELAKGSFSIDGIRRMRTVLRSRYMDNGLTMTDTQRRVNQVIDAASNDVADTLVSAGKPEAAAAYRNADKLWRQRMQNIEANISPIIGKKGEKSGEDVMRALEQASKGNGRRVQAFVQSLPQEEARAVRATFIDRMGRAKPEALAEDGGRAFSLDTFLTRWETMSPRAKATWFDRPTRAALNDVAVIARGSKAAMGYANRSNTAGGVAGQMLLTGSVGAIGGFPLLLKATAAQYITGKVLAAPGFARWVAGAPKVGTKAANKAWIGRLSVVASREPAIANEVTQLQQQLVNALNDNAPRATSAVASDRGQEEDQRPQR